MYGVVISYPLKELETFVDDSNKTYIGPLPYLTNLGPQSGYLKAVSISCEGCAVRNFIHKILVNINHSEPFCKKKFRSRKSWWPNG